MNLITRENNYLYSLGLINKGNENSLSNFTWAMCHTDPKFMLMLFEFCFNVKDIEIYHVSREVDEKENGRNDFQIVTTKGTYILESKINDTEIDRADDYLKTVNNDVTRLAYIVPNDWNGDKASLEKRGIRVVIWNDFINHISECYKEYSITASVILGIKNWIPSLKPSKEDVSKFITLCDEFYDLYFSKDKYKEARTSSGRNTWREHEEWYGYRCWASVWFGFGYCPIKGLFFCFCYSPDGEKKVIKSTTFKYIRPLGNYNNDEFIYFETKTAIKDLSLEDIKYAFEEFARCISVKENSNIYTPLLDFIQFGK